MKIIKPMCSAEVSIFLAGSVEMGKAENWQQKVQDHFEGYNVTFCNPRRDDWDNTWTQSVIDTNFRTQVEWEIKHISGADLVFFYIDPNTKAPITLWELGYCMRDPRKVIVCCPEGYWRKGNIEVYAKTFGFPFFEKFEPALDHLTTELEKRIYT